MERHARAGILGCMTFDMPEAGAPAEMRALCSANSRCSLLRQALPPTEAAAAVRSLPTRCNFTGQMVQTAGTVRQHAFPATPQAVLKHIPESCDFVLIGKASHGTHEFYRKRAELTKLLIEQRHFNAVALEAGVQAKLTCTVLSGASGLRHELLYRHCMIT